MKLQGFLKEENGGLISNYTREIKQEKEVGPDHYRHTNLETKTSNSTEEPTQTERYDTQQTTTPLHCAVLHCAALRCLLTALFFPFFFSHIRISDFYGPFVQIERKTNAPHYDTGKVRTVPNAFFGLNASKKIS